MSTRKSWLRLLSAWPLVAGIVFFVSPVQAQDADDEDGIEEITVTGSRIARDEFSTTTPIQVLNTEAAQRLGIVSISELLQKSTAASGQAVDGSISANAGQTNASEAPADGGVGSACINLRGLGCERTLVLVNGKRMGLAGIRGAPPQPDINMIPIGMVEGVDLLTGGLSTVYGADAVAGVVNVRMKKDFEGLNFTVNTDIPADTGGEVYQASLVGGVGNDSGNITFGLEYSRQERVRTGDREFSKCLRRSTPFGLSVTADGNRTENCSSGFPDNWVATFGVDHFANGTFVAADGLPVNPADGTRPIYTPDGAVGNILYGAAGGPQGQLAGTPVPGISLFSALNPTVSPSLVDCRGNCIYDPVNAPGGRYLDRFFFDPYSNDQLARQNADLWRPYERFSFVMNGHLDLDWGHNEEAYFEGYYFNRQNEVIGAREQIFPGIPGQIPLVDETNNPVLDANGARQMVFNPMNPMGVDVNPVITLDDLPQTFETELQQVRLVGGLTGDLPFSDNWGYDVSLAYDRSTGFQKQQVLLENNLFFATQNLGAVWDGVAGGTGLTGEVVCDMRFLAPGGLITPLGCVPFDAFADSINGDGVTSSGQFGSDAERDYLLGNRTNRTVTEMTILQAFVTGDLFSLWNGESVGSAFGIEFRNDKIDSQNDAIGVLGLNAAENALQEGETSGSRDTFDIYGEISAPLVVDASWAELLQVDAAIRFTDDENFGNETVYKLGALWRINEWAAFSTSFNTSFRAPNLREQFLADQAGALPGGNDPCHQANFLMATPGPALDRLLANCALSGVPDVTQLGIGFTVAIPTSTGGAAGLKPETSESLTATLTLNQPWSDRFDFDLALTYFDITIEDTVRVLDTRTIVNRCYNDQDGLASPFCDRVFRDRANTTPQNNFLSFVRAGFINTGEETSSGYDITTRFAMDFDRVNLTWATATTFLSERLSQEFPPTEADPDGSPIVEDVGRIGNPEWTFQSTVGLAMGNFDLIFQSRYWSDTQYQQNLANPIVTDVAGLCLEGCPVGTDPSVFFGDDPFTDFGYQADTRSDPAFSPGRQITDAEGQWHHDLGLTYNWETAAVTVGINNITDEQPPLISTTAGPNRNNAVTSARYDLIGTSYFLNYTKSF